MQGLQWVTADGTPCLFGKDQKWMIDPVQMRSTLTQDFASGVVPVFRWTVENRIQFANATNAELQSPRQVDVVVVPDGNQISPGHFNSEIAFLTQ